MHETASHDHLRGRATTRARGCTPGVGAAPAGRCYGNPVIQHGSGACTSTSPGRTRCRARGRLRARDYFFYLRRRVDDYPDPDQPVPNWTEPDHEAIALLLEEVERLHAFQRAAGATARSTCR